MKENQESAFKDTYCMTLLFLMQLVWRWVKSWKSFEVKFCEKTFFVATFDDEKDFNEQCKLNIRAFPQLTLRFY